MEFLLVRVLGMVTVWTLGVELDEMELRFGIYEKIRVRLWRSFDFLGTGGGGRRWRSPEKTARALALASSFCFLLGLFCIRGKLILVLIPVYLLFVLF